MELNKNEAKVSGLIEVEHAARQGWRQDLRSWSKIWGLGKGMSFQHTWENNSQEVSSVEPWKVWL